MMIFNMHAAIMTVCVVAAVAIIRWCYTVINELETEEKVRKARARERARARARAARKRRDAA